MTATPPMTTPPPGGRSRRLIPSGRATVGAALVVVAAAGVLSTHRAATAAPAERVVVATRSVPSGTVLTADDLGTVAMDLPDGMAAVTADRAEDLIGTTSRHDLREMDLVRRSDVARADSDPAEGSTIVPVEVPRTRALVDSVHSGSRVEVLATDPDGTGTRVLATDVLVVGVDDGGSDDGIGVSDRVGYRLAVLDADTAAAVVDASVRSELTIVMSTGRGGPTDG